MSTMDWSEGYRKVSKKARRGSGRLKPHAHVTHRKKLPNEYDRERAKERRMRINDMRRTEAGDY